MYIKEALYKGHFRCIYQPSCIVTITFLPQKQDSFSNTQKDPSQHVCYLVYTDTHTADGPLDSDSLPSERETTKCILDNGWSYRGKQRYTASRLRCQRWSAQWPNRHQFTKLMGGELDTASVYCRNPGGLGERPWCFINSDAQRWEYCDIPDCGELVMQ